MLPVTSFSGAQAAAIAGGIGGSTTNPDFQTIELLSFNHCTKDFKLAVARPIDVSAQP